VRYRVYVTLLDTFGVGTSSLALGLVLLLAASGMRSGHFTVGDFTLFASYVGSATSAPRWLGRLLARKRTADVALMRITTQLDDAPDRVITAPRPIGPVAPSAEPLELFEVRRLTSHYPSGARGLDDASFSLRRGEVTVVTGRVGAGKTTLLRAVLGLTAIESGEILWNGRRIDDPATFMTPPRCAYTPQSPRLFSETLRDNILMGLHDPDAEIDEAVRLAVLEDDLGRFAGGIETMVGTRGVTLSGGQIQRAAAARMFARQPELLVFDDASSALDVHTEHIFWDRLFASGRHTVLAVSHRLEAYRRAHEILLVDAGQIVARGDLRTLLRESALFREVWRETMHAHAHPEAAAVADPSQGSGAPGNSYLTSSKLSAANT
jgi:ATP-binding cassette subfamily B protein